MKSAIIIGASSGIGRELAITLAAAGYRTGLASRRKEMLDQLAGELPTETFVEELDLKDLAQATARLEALIKKMGDVDLFIINSGVGYMNSRLKWALEEESIKVNVMGFAAMANVASQYLEQRGRGHIVGISSIAGIRGNRYAPAYGASKAFISHYLEALRNRFHHLKMPVTVTDVLPGFVDTAMAKSVQKFWVASPQVAAQQIVAAIVKRKARVYVTRRWRLIAWVLKIAPQWLVTRM